MENTKGLKERKKVKCVLQKREYEPIFCIDIYIEGKKYRGVGNLQSEAIEMCVEAVRLEEWKHGVNYGRLCPNHKLLGDKKTGTEIRCMKCGKTAREGESLNSNTDGSFIECDNCMWRPDQPLERIPEGLTDEIKTIDKGVDTKSQSGEREEAKRIAKEMHDTYERLAPQYGYITRDDTKEFDEDSANGRLMIAVCEQVIVKMLSESKKECIYFTEDERDYIDNAIQDFEKPEEDDYYLALSIRTKLEKSKLV